MKIYILCIVMFAASAMAGPSIIPQPVEVKSLGGEWGLKEDAAVLYSGAPAKQSAEMLADQLRPATGFKLPVKRKTFWRSSEGNIVFQCLENPDLGTEGYALRVTDHVSIEAPTSSGLFYGAQTFRQLLPPQIYSAEKQEVPWILPAVEIRDMPRFGWRGLLLDVGRHFIPKEDVMRFIDTMASLKFNTFHWHLTEDQGWRIEIKKYPKLTEVGAWRDETMVGHLGDTPVKYDGKRYGGFYTQDDIREVVAYAAARHITIVPEIDMPGHMQAAIAAYPELGCTTNKIGVKTEWGVSKNILNPEKSTVQFCKDVLTEVMELFPSTFIHIGGDEARKDQWEASARIQQLREERGLKDMHEMQSWFIRQIDDFLVAHGRRLIGWDEIAEGGLAKNAAVMWWRGNKLSVAQKAAAEGHDVVVATSAALYFNFYQVKDRSNEPMGHPGFLPLETVYQFDPVFKGMDKTVVSHILGAQGELWTEYIYNLPHVEYMTYPRACALAEIDWLPAEQKDYSGFLERMKMQEQRFDAAGVNYRKIEQQ